MLGRAFKPRKNTCTSECRKKSPLITFTTAANSEKTHHEPTIQRQNPQINFVIWTLNFPPIGGNWFNIKIPTSITTPNRQSRFNYNSIRPLNVITQIHTADFRVLLEGSSMSRTNIRQENVNLDSNIYKTQSSRILTQFEEYPGKRAPLIKITLTTVRGQAKANLTIQRTSADMKTPIL